MTHDIHAQLHSGFRWQVPANFNIAEVCCARWARETPEAVAIHYEHEDGRVGRFSYADLQHNANRLANALVGLGVQRGDRVAIVMPQRFETAVAHMAVYQLGAVAMPLTMLFGPEALEYRLNHSQAMVAIADEGSIANVMAVRALCPALRHVIAAGDAGSAAVGRGDADWNELLAHASSRFTSVATHADDAAALIYTSGTTGPPKGALIAHRALIGNLSGFVCSQNWFPSGANTFWSPADWAWTGGLMDALLPTLYFGRSIVGYQGRFAPERAFELLQRYGVTHTFLFPTALKVMMKAVPHPRTLYQLRLRAIMSAGEAVGDAVFAYCRDELCVTVNEMFGQTEINYVVGNCGSYVDANGRRHMGWPARAGSMGRPYPGHRVAVIDDAGNQCAPGVAGDVA
ncbi:MAG: AMP-binding protein, partial [Burkholderiaceae bacterium]